MCAGDWALLAHSPNMSRYKTFLKDNAADGLPYFMPPFERKELMQLRPWVLPSRRCSHADNCRRAAARERSAIGKGCCSRGQCCGVHQAALL